jgi:hypothetical protein
MKNKTHNRIIKDLINGINFDILLDILLEEKELPNFIDLNKIILNLLEKDVN